MFPMTGMPTPKSKPGKANVSPPPVKTKKPPTKSKGKGGKPVPPTPMAAPGQMPMFGGPPK